jgi:hypothetical protein
MEIQIIVSRKESQTTSMIEVDMMDIRDFVSLLQEYPSLDEDGEVLEFTSFEYDANQNHFDLTLGEAG